MTDSTTSNSAAAIGPWRVAVVGLGHTGGPMDTVVPAATEQITTRRG